MKKVVLPILAAGLLAVSAGTASAIQCVPYAREASGINLKGDAWQWWNAAAGVYDRGRNPKESAVLVFTRQGSMYHGHVSVVTRVISNRLVLVDHANWAPARGLGRGEITRSVPVVDVSPKNDWSQVRVWFQPASDFGSRVYRTDGFVYNPVKSNGSHRPGIHMAALDRANQMFPGHAQASASATAAPAPQAQERPATAPKAPEKRDALFHVEPQKPARNEQQSVTVEIKAPEASEHPRAAAGTDGLAATAKTVFRPRQQAGSGEGMLFN